MIVKKLYETREDGVNLFKTYSDKGYYIIQEETGNKYSEAIDVENATFNYSETTEYINGGDEEITSEDFLAMVEEVL